MAVSLIAGLVRTAGSQVAKKGVKRIAVKKTKSLIKDDHLYETELIDNPNYKL